MIFTMTEKTKWFYTEFKNDTKAVILLAHGLNLLPSKMDELARFFNSKKCDVLRISLGHNPELWIENFNEEYDAAWEHSDVLQLPIYFVGYSLGGLIGVHHLLNHPNHQFAKIALIAPAIHTHFYTKIPFFLGLIFPNKSLRSSNIEEYRDRTHTTFREYKKMFQLQKEVKKLLLPNKLNIPTLLITNPSDECVASSKLLKLSDKNQNWKKLEFLNNYGRPLKKWHHLMIDSDSLGTEKWNILLQNLTAHFHL